MFKGFQQRSQQFHGFPGLSFQMNNEAYGFSGCTFWLDAAFGLNTNTNLGAITYWKDKIKGISFEQATAGNQPRLVTPDVNFNNNPSVQAAANTRYLQTLTDVSVSTNFTLAIVCKADSDNGVNVTFGRISGTISTGQSAVELTPVKIGNNTSSITATTNDTNPHIIIATNTEIAVDGVQEATGTIGETFGGFLQIFNSGSGNNNIGRVAEIIVYNQKLSSENCIILSDNLNSKYAIY